MIGEKSKLKEKYNTYLLKFKNYKLSRSGTIHKKFKSGWRTVHLCSHYNCLIQAVFSETGNKRGSFCMRHKEKNMIDVVNRKCLVDNCFIQPSFAFKNKVALFCYKHRRQDMINVRNKRKFSYSNKVQKIKKIKKITNELPSDSPLPIASDQRPSDHRPETSRARRPAPLRRQSRLSPYGAMAGAKRSWQARRRAFGSPALLVSPSTIASLRAELAAEKY